MTDHAAAGGSCPRQGRIVLYLLTGGVVVAGTYFRFKGLGKSPFAIDEYYIATSVKSILAHGLPRFECGGFYVRGILLQYLVAPLFATGMSHEYAFRLVTALSNLAALPAVWLLARHLAGVVAACLALMLFSLSLWEIEFARFARMYAPFGTLFLWHLYFVYRNVVHDDPGACRWMYLLSLVAIFVSEFAIFPILLNFLPLVLRPAHRPALAYAPPVLLLGLIYGLELPRFRRLGAGDYLPADMLGGAVPGAAPPVTMPALMLAEAAASLPWLLAYLAPLLLSITAAGFWACWALRVRDDRRKRLLALVPVGLLGLALLHLFGLVVYGLIVLLLLSRLTVRRMRGMLQWPLVRLTALGLAVSLLYWVAYMAGTDAWRALLASDTGSGFKDAVLILFGYPDVYWKVIVQWFSAMPLQTLLMTGLVTTGLWWARGGGTPQVRGYRLLAAIVTGMCVVLAALTQLYSTTRYTYFLYPVVLVLCAGTLAGMADRLARRPWLSTTAAVGLAAGLMIASEDYDARHLWRIDSDRVTYRMDLSPGRRDQYYQRWDFHAAAEVVNTHRREGDIVISSEYSVPYYLSRMDYLYMDQDDGRFRGISGCAGTRDIWEGANLLRTADSLLRLLDDAQATVWLITRSEHYVYRTSGEEDVSRLLAPLRIYRTVDGHLDVYRIAPGQARALAGLPAEAAADALPGTREEP